MNQQLISIVSFPLLSSAPAAANVAPVFVSASPTNASTIRIVRTTTSPPTSTECLNWASRPFPGQTTRYQLMSSSIDLADPKIIPWPLTVSHLLREPCVHRFSTPRAAPPLGDHWRARPTQISSVLAQEARYVPCQREWWWWSPGTDQLNYETTII